MVSNQELFIYNNNFTVIKQENNCTIYEMQDDTGIGIMECYEVFPGINIAYNNFNMQSCFLEIPPPSDVIEINHCREGRIECQFQNGSYGYLGSGDLSINIKGNRALQVSFPLSHFYGISIAIQEKEAIENLNSFFEDIPIDLSHLRAKFCAKNEFFIMRAKDSIEHIFSELYTIPNEVKNMYFKLKVLELLLFLNIVDISGEQEQRKYFTKIQVDTVKKIMKYITEYMERHITLNELSEKFEIGLTSMKLTFKGVYGTSIHAFIRNYRVQAAACCHDFIMTLPDGYETVIGDGGSTLSGGEKQRISIARAMIKNAPIVILDEATASLDPENEALIQMAIQELIKDKTLVVIAHRLATIENADQIIVVKEGAIAQRGTHNELVKQEGVYKRFLSIRQEAEGWII